MRFLPLCAAVFGPFPMSRRFSRSFSPVRVIHVLFWRTNLPRVTEKHAEIVRQLRSGHEIPSYRRYPDEPRSDCSDESVMIIKMRLKNWKKIVENRKEKYLKVRAWKFCKSVAAFSTIIAGNSYVYIAHGPCTLLSSSVCFYSYGIMVMGASMTVS